MNFSLALGGGGVRGAAHAGVIKALSENGFYTSAIAGTSIGGIIAGAYGCQLPLEEFIENLQDTGKYLIDYDYTGLTFGAIEVFLGKEFKPAGLIKGRKLYNYFDIITQSRMFESSVLPISMTSVDLISSDTVVFYSGNQPKWNKGGVRYISSAKIADGMRATSAVPGVFAPLYFDKMLLVDGGVTTMLPIDLAFSMGCSKVIAVELTSTSEEQVEPNMIPIFSRSLNIMSFPTISLENDGSLIILKPQFPSDIGLLSFSRMKECFDIGYKTAIELMPTIRIMLNEK